MRTELVKPRQFFQLRCGEVIRVHSVESNSVHCDLFDEDARQWVRIAKPLPTWTVYSPCDDPTVGDGPGGTIRRWWNSRRRQSD
jgi:hypothetical protein